MEPNGRVTVVQSNSLFKTVDRHARKRFHIFGEAISKQDSQATKEEVPGDPQKPEVREQD